MSSHLFTSLKELRYSPSSPLDGYDIAMMRSVTSAKPLSAHVIQQRLSLCVFFLTTKVEIGVLINETTSVFGYQGTQVVEHENETTPEKRSLCSYFFVTVTTLPLSHLPLPPIHPPNQQLFLYKMSLVDDIVQSVMTPGYTATGVIKLMFYAFYMLFATLAAMVIMTGGNLHVVALLLLSICLFLTIKWQVNFLKTMWDGIMHGANAHG